ncbi:MAG: TMEM198/TM7SF3 family protein [Candidatus Krumholzibacteria bacterium]|nr:TMEM198/TM7SF3 family protein [Candidatus Krumholzibacteria bacterium]
MSGITENGFAFIYIMFGLLACFWGYRMFKAVLGLIGFILGAYLVGGLTASFMGGMGLVPLIAGVAGGLICGSLFVGLYFMGIFVLGAAAGWLFGVLITSMASNSLHILLFIILALVGGILAVTFQKTIIVVATAILGSWYLVAGSFFFMGSGYTPMITFRDPAGLSMSGDGPGIVIIACWLALAVSGMIFQFKYSKNSDDR